jgi:hypothetical protein
MEQYNKGQENYTLPASISAGEKILTDRKEIIVPAPVHPVFENFTSLGGERGWLYFDWAWKLRGWIDKLIGGVGMRNDVRDSKALKPDDIVDFWRVEEVIPNRLLRLRAEMLFPGKAWLEFEAISLHDNSTKLDLRSYFVPHGIGGLIYWYALYPIHTLIFSGLVRRIAQTSVSWE